MEQTVLATIAAELRAARGRRRLTQSRLAELSGLSKATVSRFENEEREAKVGQLLALAKALQIPATELLPALSQHAEGVTP